jgi:hypothetical protein
MPASAADQCAVVCLPVSTWRLVASVCRYAAEGVAEEYRPFMGATGAAERAISAAILVANAAMTAWAVIAPIFSLVTAVATGTVSAFGLAMAVLTAPVTLIVLAIVALIAIVVLLWKNWDTVTKALVAAFNWVKGALAAAFNAIKTSNPTVPLPDAYPDDRMVMTVIFYYNETPPGGGGLD